MPAPHCRVWIFRTISGSQMGSQLLQKVQIIKKIDLLLWKIWNKYGSVSNFFSCTMASWYKLLKTPRPFWFIVQYKNHVNCDEFSPVRIISGMLDGVCGFVLENWFILFFISICCWLLKKSTNSLMGCKKVIKKQEFINFGHNFSGPD